MNKRHLIIRNISKHKSFYRLIAVAVVVAVAVITGSLVVGDSVRSTLVKRVDERLGKTETIIFSKYSYLNDSILVFLNADNADDADLRGNNYIENENKISENPRYPRHLRSTSTRGILLMNGFVSVSGQLTPVMVWGTDDLNIKRGQAKINNALFDAIKAKNFSPLQGEHVVLRLPAAGMVPLGSMFVTDTYTTSLRLELNGIVSIEQGGNLNLKNEQTIPFNIFVNREELAEAMDVSGKINVILSDRIITKDEFAAAWNYEISGLNVETENSVTTVTSDRIFIQDKVVETLCDSASNRVFTYLANSIGRMQYAPTSIPYSFITAVDFYKGEKINPNEIILSDYAAKRLNIGLGDTVSIRYFVSRQFKTLLEDSVFLRVSKIVPIEDLQANKTLVAEFPGLSNVERCTDWNSDLPINMNLISDEDENFWRKYKNTPKAIVPYATLAPRWENAFGSATALQINHINMNHLNDLSYEMFDVQLIYPREAGITAAKSGVDFSSLFLSLGFFIVISAGMLMIVPLSEMLFRRRDELNLLKATGFSNKRIARLLLRESTPVVLVSAIAGVIAGLLYTYLVLFLLGTVWKGATHTEGFRLYPDAMTIAIGMSAGIVFSILLLYICIKKRTQMTRITRISADNKFIKNNQQNKNPRESASSASSVFKNTKLIRASIRYNKKQALLSFVTLACGVLIVFSVGLNRRSFADSSQIRTATGGFALWVETAVPVYHNINTEEGRAKLGLTGLSKNAQIIQLLKYSADDASCLNLNKVVTPNVLGIDINELKNSDFKITKTIFDDSDKGTLMTRMTQISADNNSIKSNNQQNKNLRESALSVSSAFKNIIPALVDETVLQWSLGKKLGDTLFYTGEKGEIVPIVLAGTLQSSIFQGSILIDKSYFSEIWSEISGSEIMLVSVPDEEIAETKTLISQALNNYGVRVTTTAERLKMFYSVTDTYLTIFLTLGGLGLLLGIFSFVIVVRKNLLARAKEITLYRSLGFDEKRIFNLLYKENIIIPISAIFIGALGSLPGVILGFGNVSVGNWALAGGFLAGFVFCVVWFVKGSVRRFIRRLIF